jgi:hypothetical protein
VSVPESVKKTPAKKAEVTPAKSATKKTPKSARGSRPTTPARGSTKKVSRSRSRSSSPKKLSKQGTIDATKQASSEYLKGEIPVHPHGTRSAEKAKRRK